MNRQELAYHYELILKQPDISGVRLLNEILDDAIELLAPWVDKVQRSGLNDQDRQLYADKGIDISWQLRQPHDAAVFNLAARDILPKELLPAALLTRLCTAVIAGEDNRPNTVQQIINAYRQLDSAQAYNQRLAANNKKNANFKQRKDALMEYWQGNIDPNLSASKAAELLKQSDVYTQYKKPPKDEVLERYIREWQELLKQKP